MPRFDKWLTGIADDAPVDLVARRALKTRLRAVAWYLARIHKDEPEVVHQLRIWTRRAAAALKLFAATLPARRRRWMKRTLRKVRRAAGQVRDSDVLIARLQAQVHTTGLDRVVQRLEKQRRRARKALRSVRRDLVDRGRFAKKNEALLKEIAWPKRHSSRVPPHFGPWSQKQLRPLADSFFRLGETDLSRDLKLHEFRLAGKRLRYAVELAASAMPGESHSLLYEDLSDLQKRLGEICDKLAAVEQFEAWIAAEKEIGRRRLLRTLLDEEQTQFERARSKFLRWWTPSRRAKLRRRWVAVSGRGRIRDQSR
jgi:CHAD domain-containing protein